MNSSIDCWHSFTGGDRADLAESSGIWKFNIDGDTLRTRTLDRYLKVKTLLTRPKLGRVLATAKFVLESSPPSSLQYTLDSKIRMLELTLDALGFWDPKRKITKYKQPEISKYQRGKRKHEGS